MQVAAEMEKELNKPKAKAKGVLDDDTAVAAYAEFMGSGQALRKTQQRWLQRKPKRTKKLKLQQS